MRWAGGDNTFLLNNIHGSLSWKEKQHGDYLGTWTSSDELWIH